MEANIMLLALNINQNTEPIKIGSLGEIIRALHGFIHPDHWVKSLQITDVESDSVLVDNKFNNLNDFRFQIPGIVNLLSRKKDQERIFLMPFGMKLNIEAFDLDCEMSNCSTEFDVVQDEFQMQMIGIVKCDIDRDDIKSFAKIFGIEVVGFIDYEDLKLQQLDTVFGVKDNSFHLNKHCMLKRYYFS